LALPSAPVVVVPSVVTLDFEPGDFDGDFAAAREVQGVLQCSSVSIDVLGSAAPGDRGSLLLVASQAMKNGVQGFGFDGLPGKYEVALSMSALVDLHRQAAVAVAVESTKASLGVWANGDKVSALDDWVPDSVQRLLLGSVSSGAALTLVDAIDSGSIARHAGDIGVHEYTALLAEQGLNVDALTVDQAAYEFGWSIKDPDRSRGQYFGPVVALDHRASLVKFTRTDVVELPFASLAKEQARPVLGDVVRLDFKGGQLSVNVAGKSGRESVGR
jgi:hypothetical protein